MCMRWLKITAVGLLLGMACAAAAAELWHDRDEKNVPLYVSMEIRQAGHVVARPQLVGTSGHTLHMLLRRRDGSPRLSLELDPTLRGPRVGLDLELNLPLEHGLGQSMVLQHGQEATFTLSRDVQVKVLVMRVKSPEFEAYIADAPAITEAPREDRP